MPMTNMFWDLCVKIEFFLYFVNAMTSKIEVWLKYIPNLVSSPSIVQFWIFPRPWHDITSKMKTTPHWKHSQVRMSLTSDIYAIV